MNVTSIPRRSRSPRSWNRQDALLVLATYIDHGGIPPESQRRRVANLTRHSIDEVTRRFGMFAALDPDHPATGDAGKREQGMWAEFADDKMACLLAADDVMADLRRVPHHLRRQA